MVAIESGPQRAKAETVFQSDTYGLNLVPFNTKRFSAACEVRDYTVYYTTVGTTGRPYPLIHK
jgi:hypothetical protein